MSTAAGELISGKDAGADSALAKRASGLIPNSMISAGAMIFLIRFNMQVSSFFVNLFSHKGE
jgi:hypothetical protein